MYTIRSSFENNENSREDILFLYEIIDQKNAEILEIISSSIFDINSALAAKDFYDKNWFCDLISSVEYKVKIANLLKQICGKYGISSNTWELISEGSTSILEQIDILKNKNKFRSNFEG